MSDPYKVVVDPNTAHCLHCGAGAMWTIEQPDGALIATSWVDEDTATDACELMNLAFAAGAESKAGTVQ